MVSVLHSDTSWLGGISNWYICTVGGLEDADSFMQRNSSECTISNRS